MCVRYREGRRFGVFKCPGVRVCVCVLEGVGRVCGLYSLPDGLWALQSTQGHQETGRDLEHSRG